MVNLGKLARYEREKLKRSTRAEQFRYFCVKLLNAQYVLGRENLFQTDCSGSICWPLFCIDPKRFNIRMTARDLFKNIYIHAGYLVEWYAKALAIFYEKAGRIVHVSPIVGRGVILDAWDPDKPVILKALDPVMDYYIDNHYSVYIRELDWRLAEDWGRRREFSWDREADEILKELAKPTPVEAAQEYAKIRHSEE